MSGHHYPPGPMLGSGIDDYDTQGVAWCEDCEDMVPATLWWRGLHYTFTCPECGADGEGSL